MNKHLKALLVVLGLGAMVIAAYSFYQSEKTSDGDQIYSFYQKMETNGLKDFRIVDIDKRSLDQESLKGKITIINFWASWCTPCVAEIPSLISMVKQIGADKVNLIAISGDSDVNEMMAFLKSYPDLKQPSIYIVWENYKGHMKDFNVDRLPESFIFDSNLKLRKKVTGEIDWSSPESVNYLRGFYE